MCLSLDLGPHMNIRFRGIQYIPQRRWPSPLAQPFWGLGHPSDGREAGANRRARQGPFGAQWHWLGTSQQFHWPRALLLWIHKPEEATLTDPHPLFPPPQGWFRQAPSLVWSPGGGASPFLVAGLSTSLSQTLDHGASQT